MARTICSADPVVAGEFSAVLGLVELAVQLAIATLTNTMLNFFAVLLRLNVRELNIWELNICM